MTSLLSSELIPYFKLLLLRPDVIGAHDSKIEIRGELGFLMKTLNESDHNKDVSELLCEIYTILKLKYPVKDFEKEYFIYLRLIVDREDKIDANTYCKRLKLVESLSRNKWNHWGSFKQFIFGRCIVDALNVQFGYKLHPIWGCLLSSTGGVTGPGSTELISKRWDSYMSLHSCVHDAAGYLYNYHGLGPGYNYLRIRWTIFPTSSPMSCQYSGLRFWKKFIDTRWEWM